MSNTLGGRPPLESKRCPRCWKTKPRADFLNASGTLRHHCLPCNRSRSLEYYHQQSSANIPHDLPGLPVVPAGEETVPRAGLASEAPAPIRGEPLPPGPTPVQGRDFARQSTLNASTASSERAPQKAQAGTRAARLPAPLRFQLQRRPADHPERQTPVRTPPAGGRAAPVRRVVRPPAVGRPSLALDLGLGSGRGIGWPCNHTMEQIGGKRCIDCCDSKPKHYVLLVARGGSPAAYRWLCDPCLAIYQADGRVETTDGRWHMEAKQAPGYHDGYGGEVSA